MPLLAFSIVASVVLTVVVNLVLWCFPGAAARLHGSLARLAERSTPDPRAGAGRTTTRVIFPWRMMLVASLVLTVAINLAFVLLR